jgi:hypothetical protein
VFLVVPYFVFSYIYGINNTALFSPLRKYSRIPLIQNPDILIFQQLFSYLHTELISGCVVNNTAVYGKGM